MASYAWLSRGAWHGMEYTHFHVSFRVNLQWLGERQRGP